MAIDAHESAMRAALVIGLPFARAEAGPDDEGCGVRRSGISLRTATAGHPRSRGQPAVIDHQVPSTIRPADVRTTGQMKL
jgi:hypothetical protein